MLKRIAISTALAGGLFAGVLGVAGAANASYDGPYYGPSYGPSYGPVPGQYDYDHAYAYDARCQVPADGSILIGPQGLSLGLPGAGIVTAGPSGLGYALGC